MGDSSIKSTRITFIDEENMFYLSIEWLYEPSV
jgi:hypothetical protein